MKIAEKFQRIKNEKCEKPNKAKIDAQSFFKSLDMQAEIWFNLQRSINPKVLFY